MDKILKTLQDGLDALEREQKGNLMYRLSLEGIHYHNHEIPVYKYLTCERAKEILAGNSVFYGTCKNFNDPFEFHPALLEPKYEEALQHARELALRGNDDIDDEERDKFLTEIERTKGNYMKKLEGIFEGHKKRLGIFCASKSYRNTLLWSHYGDGHKGICLGFHFRPTEQELTYSYLNVAYKHEIAAAPYDFVDHQANYFALIRWMNIKSKVWEYEQEIRIINFARNGIVPLDNMEIKEVYFGVATPEKDRDDINKLLAEKKYRISKKGEMQINEKTFDLEVRDL